MLFGVFGAKKRQKALKKHSLGHSEPGAPTHSKSTPEGTFWPGPLSTPVNGGWDLWDLLPLVKLEEHHLRFGDCPKERGVLQCVLLPPSPHSYYTLPHFARGNVYNQRFRKGVGGRRGWREEILHMPEIQASFLYPFSYAPLGEGGHISGELFARDL